MMMMIIITMVTMLIQIDNNHADDDKSNHNACHDMFLSVLARQGAEVGTPRAKPLVPPAACCCLNITEAGITYLY